MHEVFLFHSEAWMRQVMRQIAIVGQDDETLAIQIKTPDGMHARLGRDKIHDRHTILWIFRCRDDVVWLMQQVVHQVRSDSDLDTINGHTVGIDVNSAAEFGDDAVNGDSTILDQGLADATAPETSLSKDLL